ncbi:MAG: DUF3786 domain-containing protein [Nitrospirae bacterium]|nr:DUF3786 domain-containing protein [Nitrospirota bacterium]
MADEGSSDPISVYSGEDKAWTILSSADPGKVCADASVAFDRSSGTYSVKSFGSEFFVSPSQRTISSPTESGKKLIERPDCFFRLSMLWYLSSAKNIPLKGLLVKPEQIKGGQIFARGTHKLPLNDLAEKYSSDRDGFMNMGLAYGGEQEQYGDAAFRLLPFPRLPVFLTLWLEDEEFPARADLLFDATCVQQAPVDVLWSIAMMCVNIMLI